MNEAQVVYKNGTVVTVDGLNTMAQALAVRDGRIIAVGSADQVNAYVGSNTKVIDLAGKTVIPGIYDAHSHFTYTGINAKFEANLNSPPISTVMSIDDVVALLQQQQASLGADAWVTGFGYDDTLIAEGRHPTRDDLDRVSSTQPVFITHVSGHLAVANSAALALAGITSATPNPAGGVIRKDVNGNPDGVLEETAVQLVSKFKPALTGAQIQEAIKAAAALYAAQGVTTANEGATTAGGVAALEQAAQSNDLPLRVVAWPMLETMASVDKVELKSGKVKVGGVKDFADGSIQGYTGYLGHPYHTPFHGDADYKGFPRYDRELLAKRVLDVHKSGRQSLIHGNGDAAIADILYAFRKAQQAYPRDDVRPVVIHSQMARDEDLDEMKALGVIPSFFVLHTYYWGDRHRDIFIGPERASRISPTRSAKDRGITYTIHTDTPIVPMEPMRLIWSAVNRTSTSGAVIGAEQRVPVIDALRATTINAAYQNFEEKERGSIEVGKWADLAILSANPLTVAPATIKDIKVLETIAEGKSIYKAGP
ncbi:MAG: amidohydrolase [Burkholderiaceae bacterium]